KLGPLFTPQVVSKREGPLGTLLLPNVFGGANWPGGSLDPETGILYVYSSTSIMSLGLVKPDPTRSDMNFVAGTAAKSREDDKVDTPIPITTSLEIDGLPLVKPPYGRITAIDLNKGDIIWQIPHGETPETIKNHPLLKDL